MSEKYSLINGYNSRNSISSATLVGTENDKTAIFLDNDCRINILASDLTLGNGEKSVINNGWDSKVIMFASDLPLGNGDKTAIFNGYEVEVAFNPLLETPCDCQDSQKIVNGWNARSLFLSDGGSLLIDSLASPITDSNTEQIYTTD